MSAPDNSGAPYFLLAVINILRIFYQRQNMANQVFTLRAREVNGFMDKVTRILFLYRSLMKGALVYKSSFCQNYGISNRSFDRDIQDIRLFLSESFSNMELVFDETRRGYYLKNLDIKREIGIGETYILTKLLLGSCHLRTDDREEIIKIMLSQLSSVGKQRIIPVLGRSPEILPCLCKASVKLVEDLLLSIERNDRITLQFGPQYQEHSCVPYSVEFQGKDAYLVAWSVHQNGPKLYILDDILSYVPNYPCILSQEERDRLQELVLLVNDSEPETYRSFIYERELAYEHV